MASVEEKIAASGRPNACNLCHLDKSLRWILAELNRGWGVRLEPRPGWEKSYGGNLDGLVGEVWLNSHHSTTRLMATQAYARSPLGKSKVREVLRSLNDPVPVNRTFAEFAAERLLGRPLRSVDMDITATPARRIKQMDAVLSPVRKSE